MKIWGVIPARYGASRFPGKPLALIHGQPMISWVIRGAQESRMLSEVVVATDDDRIAAAARSLGVRVVLTGSHLPTGTDRVWAAAAESVRAGETAAEILLNIQGDEPLVSGDLLDSLIKPLVDDPQIPMATLGSALQAEDLNSLQVAKVVVNHQHDAIYFSRLPIPFSRRPYGEISVPNVFKHIGIYAYRRDFLNKFCEQVACALEEAEGLEQLRALYLGARCRVVPTNHICCGVDVPSDIAKIEQLMDLRGQ